MDGKHEIPGRQRGNCKETLTKIDYWSSLHTNIFTTYRGLWCGIWIWPMSPATTSLSDGGWRSLGMTELEFGHWIYLQTVTLRQVMYASLRLLAQGSPTQLRNDPHLARAAWTNDTPKLILYKMPMLWLYKMLFRDPFYRGLAWPSIKCPSRAPYFIIL